MGMIESLLSLVFGGSRNVVKDTVEVFRENTEASAQRAQDVQIAAMQGFVSEFRATGRGRFDRLMDAVNRLPRPAMALGVLGLFVSAMVDPLWFSQRMVGIALVPEPLWWLLGVVVSFYFGARHQAKGQAFQQEIAQSMVQVPQLVAALGELKALKTPAARFPNQALEDWRKMAMAGQTKSGTATM